MVEYIHDIGAVMTVTAVEQYTGGKYKIYLNDEFAFVLYKGELRRLGIEPGSELSPEHIREIVDGVILKRAKLRAMNLLKSRDYTERTLRRKLEEGLYPDEVIDEAVSWLKEYGYIDDYRYAASYIRNNKATKSRKELRLKLIGKGVSSETVDHAFEEEGDNPKEEDKLIRRLLTKKLRGADASGSAEKRRILAYMYAKGFSVDKVERILDEVLLDITS